jgi:hypothetical protein
LHCAITEGIINVAEVKMCVLSSNSRLA